MAVGGIFPFTIQIRPTGIDILQFEPLVDH